MSEKEPLEGLARSSFAAEARWACASCGREDSGAWYWSDQLQRVICIDCHWRLPAPPPAGSASRKP